MRETKFRAWINDTMFYFDIPSSQHYRWDKNKLMQYTGLKDKNGKEIYEGDIVKEHPNKHVGEIKSHDTFLHFFVDWNSDYPDWSWSEMAYDHMSRIEVIDNIYENPELIK